MTGTTFKLIDEARIQFALFQELMARGNYAVFPNVSWCWLSWEADIIAFSKAWYMSEYEIKITRQDFEKDFKKFKHLRFKEAGSYKSSHIPNYFHYVAPLKAMPLCVPDHAGLILLESNKHGFKFKTIKKAPLLHKVKADKAAMLAMFMSLMFKFWGLAKVLDQNKIQRDLFKNG